MPRYDFKCKVCQKIIETDSLKDTFCCNEKMFQKISCGAFYFKHDFANKDYPLLKGTDRDKFHSQCGGDLFEGK